MSVDVEHCTLDHDHAKCSRCSRAVALKQNVCFFCRKGKILRNLITFSQEEVFKVQYKHEECLAGECCEKFMLSCGVINQSRKLICPCHPKLQLMRHSTNKESFFSEPETILRAVSKVDDMDYNIFENNCEHFAVWCKTGKMKSFQVRHTKPHSVSCAIPVVKTIFALLSQHSKLFSPLFEQRKTLNKTVTRTALGNCGKLVTNQTAKRLVTQTPSLAKALGERNRTRLKEFLSALSLDLTTSQVSFHALFAHTTRHGNKMRMRARSRTLQVELAAARRCWSARRSKPGASRTT